MKCLAIVLLFIFSSSGIAADSQFKQFLELAEQGDEFAQYNLCVAYLNGIEIEKNYEEAAKWCSKAADQGLPKAQAQIGMLYDHGLGVEKDHKAAVNWYGLAGNQGNVMAIHNLGASYAMGQGVDQSYEGAAHHYLLAAEKGYADSQFAIARMYEIGQGVPKDESKALFWFAKLVLQKDPRAKAALQQRYKIIGFTVVDNKTMIFQTADGSGYKIDVSENENAD